jgi:hypothetical protein
MAGCGRVKEERVVGSINMMAVTTIIGPIGFYRRYASSRTALIGCLGRAAVIAGSHMRKRHDRHGTAAPEFRPRDGNPFSDFNESARR